ncbi:NmrA family NAD(P)-binding protein [Solirubrobacter ginsenosidimutans]|uniref:NmrA family NAD(P)-binding protein n=1 Tax=Solirubrobacter ginsenosidimutans TaxID=490573 RepID=A0A9X3MZ94_9ACTN|nr:NmrA family NAD(P)-binding protein [Solirubrobacter ginsenosidimutans]MDA0163897.1 NmrA family NAD(P)-binding protein [Solirubrobacter ginsenosidimutans]
MTKTIAVHGATGSQGAPVADAFIAAGHVVRPLTRATGADLLDRASLEAAYAGADAVVLHLPIVYDERVVAMADNAARAVEAAGVRHLVLNTGGPAPGEKTGVPFLDARVHAAAADVPLVTVLLPTAYMENLSAPWSAERLVRDGVVAYPLPAEAPMPWVATADVAAAAVRAVEDAVTGWFALPGVPVTGHEVAAQLGAVLDRELRWEPIAPREFGERLRPFLGDHAAEGTATVYEMLAAAPRGPAPDPAAAREALGWAPRSVAEWASEVSWPLARTAA